MDRRATRAGVFACSTNYLIDVDNAIIVVADHRCPERPKKTDLFNGIAQ